MILFDKSCNTNTVEKNIIITDSSKYGTALITVVDEDSRGKLGNTKVFIRYPDGTTGKDVCASDGTYQITGDAGNYEICFYKEDYLPTSLKFTLEKNEYKEETAEMKYGKIVVGTMSVKRLSLDEIEAVGIDTDAPENQVVYKYEVKVAFGVESEEKDIYVNDHGGIYYKKFNIGNSG